MTNETFEATYMAAIENKHDQTDIGSTYVLILVYSFLHVTQWIKQCVFWY